MTVAPRSTTDFEARAPSIFPWAVRAAPTITMSSGEGAGFWLVMVFVVPFVRGSTSVPTRIMLCKLFYYETHSGAP